HVFHITSDEVLSWNQIYQAVAGAAGVADFKKNHISSDFIHACLPQAAQGLLGDKANCALFGNNKNKRFVPDFLATTPLHEGIKRTMAWFDADPARREINDEDNAAWDRLIAAYERGLEAARREFS